MARIQVMELPEVQTGAVHGAPHKPFMIIIDQAGADPVVAEETRARFLQESGARTVLICAGTLDVP